MPIYNHPKKIFGGGVGVNLQYIDVYNYIGMIFIFSCHRLWKCKMSKALM